MPLVARKVAKAAPADTTAEVGTVRVAGLEERITAVAAVTALERVTVHAVLPLAIRVDTVHCSDEIIAGAIRLKLVEIDVPVREAVTVTV